MVVKQGGEAIPKAFIRSVIPDSLLSRMDQYRMHSKGTRFDVYETKLTVRWTRTVRRLVWNHEPSHGRDRLIRKKDCVHVLDIREEARERERNNVSLAMSTPVNGFAGDFHRHPADVGNGAITSDANDLEVAKSLQRNLESDTMLERLPLPENALADDG